ncbi:MAG: type II toxin-antitoxin system HicB family antitoxin [Methanoregula sp.]|nr:type II toxin-antitoxin system HicB family antitoxin [Methanoregula sp.]
MVSYIIIIEEGKRNFSAYCPDLPGVIATGKTEEKTFKNMKEAIKFHLEGLREEKQSLPSPMSRVRKIQIPKKLFEKPIPA